MQMNSLQASNLFPPRSQESLALVHNLLKAALLECCSVAEFEKLQQTSILSYVAERAHEDLIAFTQKDPAAMGDPLYIAKSYTSYAAVMHYRLAHELYTRHNELADHPMMSLAATVSRRGKMLSGAEIHYRCSIGSRFVLDHGVGTVVGETSVVGEDCYFLSGVTLGAHGISDNRCAPRHPHIGNRVQIGAFASVLGCISVGEDAFIGPGCIVSEDVPPKARVQIKTSLQIQMEGMKDGQ